MEIRYDWQRDEIHRIYHLSLRDLIFQAQLEHGAYHKPDEIQLCRLLSIKTGGCPEDCAYCSQSAHYRTGVAREELMSPAAVREAANHAKKEGATRFCMGAAWRQVSDGDHFDRVLDMVRAVAALIMVRAVATARVLMPASRVRLAAGRRQLSPEAVALCFLAGANSIFTGEKLLTTPNPSADADQQLLENLGMKATQSA